MQSDPTPKQAAYEPQFYSVKQTAELLGCSKANVSIQIKRGKIPAVRIGAYPYIPREWIDQQRQAAYASLNGAAI
jgi:excisionase family DNA binding protein